MANGQVDPASLEGEALLRWYRRTPQEIEEERRRAATEAYNRFFYPTQSDQTVSSNDAVANSQDPSADGTQSPIAGSSGQANAWSSYGLPPRVAQPTNWSTPLVTAPSLGLLGDWSLYNGQSNREPDYGTSTVVGRPAQWTATSGRDNPTAPPDDTLWIATGSGGYRAVRPGNSNLGLTLGAAPDQPGGLPENPAAPEDANFIEVGNPYNRRLRREQEKASGQPWPKTNDGRNYHVAHKRAIADGGTNTLDNVEPMHPDDHVAQHLSNGDSARWGKRASIARAFGGTVEPPMPGRTVRGLGLLGIIPWITGFLSGNIRTDTPVHTWYDMAGFPAPDDYDKMVDPNCRAMGINKPGGMCT